MVKKTNSASGRPEYEYRKESTKERNSNEASFGDNGDCYHSNNRNAEIGYAVVYGKRYRVKQVYSSADGVISNIVEKIKCFWKSMSSDVICICEEENNGK